MKRGVRTDTNGLACNRGRRGGRKQSVPDPNELLIELEASAVRLAWVQQGLRDRKRMGLVPVRPVEPIAMEVSRAIRGSA
jgi:hypothetical protein